LALTIDRNLLLAVLAANAALALGAVLLLFRDRRGLDRALIGLGLFFVISVVSVVVLHAFARTPVREVQFFALD
ncbi:MAG: hypothetical protein KC583_12750, partial [Myxococcales bacterium]|nr:hypothetical protein [Myxococcales bacterium]